MWYKSYKHIVLFIGQQSTPNKYDNVLPNWEIKFFIAEHFSYPITKPRTWNLHIELGNAFYLQHNCYFFAEWNTNKRRHISVASTLKYSFLDFLKQVYNCRKLLIRTKLNVKVKSLGCPLCYSLAASLLNRLYVFWGSLDLSKEVLQVKVS